MSKAVCIIGCKSSQNNLKNMLRSIIRVYSGLSVSQLKLDWVFADDSDNSALDICVIDLDDEDLARTTDKTQYKAVIAISKSPLLLQKYKYRLTKPIHNSTLLDILKQLENNELASIKTTTASTIVEPKLEQKPQVTSPTPTATLTQEQSVVEATLKSTLYYQLTNWPDLTKIPADFLLNTSRVCALIATKPRQLSYISQFLSLNPDETENIIKMICQNSFATFPAIQHIELQERAENTTPQPPIEVPPAPPQNTSFLSKMWNKLKGTF